MDSNEVKRVNSEDTEASISERQLNNRRQCRRAILLTIREDLGVQVVTIFRNTAREYRVCTRIRGVCVCVCVCCVCVCVCVSGSFYDLQTDVRTCGRTDGRKGPLIQMLGRI